MSTNTMTKLQRREELEGYLYISPWIAGFIIFVIGPMIASIYLSLTQYNLLEAPRFVGVRNYTYMITKDELFWGSLGRTLYYAGVSIPLGVTGDDGARNLAVIEAAYQSSRERKFISL